MKKKKYPKIWKRFFQMLYKSHLPYVMMVLALCTNIVSAYIGLKLPELTSRLVVSVTRQTMMMIFVLGMISVALALLAAATKNWARMIIDRNMQYLAVDKIMYLKMDDIEKSDPREMVSRVTTDTKLLSELLLLLAVDELPRLYYMVGALITVYKNYDTTLGNVMLLSIPVVLLGSWFVGRLTFGKADAAQAAISRLTARLGEKVNNMPIIKSYNSQKKEAESGDVVIRDLETNLRKKAVIDRLAPAMTSLATLIPTVGVIAIGASFVLSGKIETAVFVAYYGLAGTFIGYVVAHMTLWIAMKNAQGATYRLSQILDKSDEHEGRTKTGATGDIEFKDVCKSFGEHVVLERVSFTLEEGKKTALVGYSGSGKSTVLNLIEQFYRPDSGVITMGGVPITEWDMKSYRGNFTYVPQNAPGFSGSIRELLTYGNEDVDDDTLWKVLKKVDAEGFVKLLGGLDYEIGNNAEKLSGGQKQKLCLARALMNPRDIMLLDEATSALDVGATKHIQSLLDQRMRGKTMILVAHNISTVLNADKIIVFDEGKVIAEGTHRELLESCKLYRSLAEHEEGGSRS